MTESELRTLESNYQNAICARRRARDHGLSVDEIIKAAEELELLLELLASSVPVLVEEIRHLRGVPPPPPAVDFKAWRKINGRT